MISHLHRHNFIITLNRLETVELIITKRPELIRTYNSRAAGIMFANTPLHLASRNGHKYVFINRILCRYFDKKKIV